MRDGVGRAIVCADDAKCKRIALRDVTAVCDWQECHRSVGSEGVVVKRAMQIWETRDPLPLAMRFCCEMQLHGSCRFCLSVYHHPVQ